MRKWRKPETLDIEVRPASLATTIEVLTEDDIQKERTRCTVCGDRQEWYRLEPGTGRCTRCMP